MTSSSTTTSSSEAAEGVEQDLLRPEIVVGPAGRDVGRDAVPAEEGDVADRARSPAPRQHAGVHREEAGQRVMAVFVAADGELLQVLADAGTSVARFVATFVAQKPFWSHGSR